MTETELVAAVSADVRHKLEGAESGHDWWHVYRVLRLAEHIAEKEGMADMFVVRLAALLHDIADWKFHDGDDTIGPKVAREIMEKYQVPEYTVTSVCTIIRENSFKGAGVKTASSTLEGKIVQDADRLDAIGAIGIARTFAYGGHKGRPLHDPEAKPVLHATKKAYAKSTSSTINHFYEKLLLLKDLMNTKTAKEIAQDRHALMESYLEQFLKEWEGNV